jgi:uncharacterized membrane protein YsdA (DUF1294 family)
MIGWALAGWVVLVNLLAFAAMGIDKARAVRGTWRLSEAYLLMLAAAGGWFGAKAGQRVFRHKTRKQPFGARLNRSLAMPVLAAILLLTPVVPMAVQGMGLPHLTQALWAQARGPEAPDADPAKQWGMPAGLSHDGPLPRRFGPGSGD